jgi:pimeloyl-ACP methyl ester carboxylesterase
VTRLAFLPGASGDREFWRPVARRLPDEWEMQLLNWPGAGDEPHDPAVRGFDDLVGRAARQIEAPADVIAQSMGGVIAIRLALAHPERVRRLVLVATSGGVDVSAFGGADWRQEYQREFPHAASWVTHEQRDLTDELRQLAIPTLLIWGDADPISPPRVGARLAELLPVAQLHVIAGGTHGVAYEQPEAVAGLIAGHLG